MLSETQIRELLDFATDYGRFDENSPDTAYFARGPGKPYMCLGRRIQILDFKIVLGLLPFDFSVERFVDDFYFKG